MSDGSIKIRMPVVGSTVDIVGGNRRIKRHRDFEVERIGSAVRAVVRIIDGGESFIGGVVIEGDIHAFECGAALRKRQPVALFIELDRPLDPPIVEPLDDILLHFGDGIFIGDRNGQAVDVKSGGRRINGVIDVLGHNIFGAFDGT